jgi:hypothetical protein
MSKNTDYKSNMKGHEIITSLLPSNTAADLSSSAAERGKLTGFVISSNKGNGAIGVGVPIYKGPSTTISIGGSSTFGGGRPNQSFGGTIRAKF